MAGATASANAGKSTAGEMIGKDVNYVHVSKSNISQAEMDTVIREVSKTGTILAIGTFVAGTTDSVNVSHEGPAVTMGSDFGGATGVTSSATLHTSW